MATVQDVRRFVFEHSGESFDRVVGKVAGEFGLAREEAAHMVRDIATERAGSEDLGNLPGRVVWADEVIAASGGAFSVGRDQGPGLGNQWGGADAAGLGATALGDRHRSDGAKDEKPRD